jgi:hypothetical protein
MLLTASAGEVLEGQMRALVIHLWKERGGIIKYCTPTLREA